ncbi:hypothetical protein DL96DRAFT_1816682 [Flagelloscypha sp. PMI_526]|nr:hypothetical protein DL96DRAFT_1816682 [Flagelloscypha sp. PMI_526]
MPSIPLELYPLILGFLPLETLKICSLTNRAIHELALPSLFHSVILRDDLTALLGQLSFFNRKSEARVTQCIREIHLNIDSMAGTTPAALEYMTFFDNIAPRLSVLDISGRKIYRKYGSGRLPQNLKAVRDLLVDFILRSTSLVSITVGKDSPILLAELVPLCPSVSSIILIDPDAQFLQTSSRGKRDIPLNTARTLHSLTLQCHDQWNRSSALSIMNLVGQSINLAYPGTSSKIRYLSLHGFFWLTKREVTEITGWLLSPNSLFNNLHQIHFPQVLFQSIDGNSLPISFLTMPTLKRVIFTIGAITSNVSRKWSIFFEWLLKVLSESHSLEELVFEVLLHEYRPIDDLMMTMDVFDSKADPIPVLTFVLVMRGMERSEEIFARAFTKWLKRELPTLRAAGKLNIKRRWE